MSFALFPITKDDHCDIIGVNSIDSLLLFQ